MRILFTGSSSFTGYWFARELVACGHDVVMTFCKDREEYSGVRRERVEKLAGLGQTVFGLRFGDRAFLDLATSDSGWQMLCHHGAEVNNYKSSDFDVVAAVENNTHNLKATLDALAEKGCTNIMITGSVFEPGEGAGSEGLPAFSPYGLSKALAAQVFDYYAKTRGMGLGKFVIPNPFGPMEEPRFTHYLVKTWYDGQTAQVRTPAYVRDNIHVSLLAKAYATFAHRVQGLGGFTKLNPSGYVESQGAFALRFAQNMHKRLGIACPVKLVEQLEFSEPRIRINTDMLDVCALAWDEQEAWDDVAMYYQQMLAVRSVR